MNQLVINGSATMSSREIAKLLESRHSDVVRTIDRLIDRKAVSGCAPSAYTHEQNGQTYMEYLVSKRDSYVIVAQLSPEFTARLVDRWQELEALQVPSLPKSFADALRLAADQQEQIEHQREQLAIAAPKVEFVDRYVEATGLKGFRQVAKLLNAKEPKLRDFLSEYNIMYKLGGEWVPYQNHIDAGRFEVRTGASDGGHAFNQAKFTPKGVQWIAGLWAQHLMLLKV